LSLWCDQAAASILSLPPDLKRRFWVVLDEVASLQELPALTPDGGLLTMSRKHGDAARMVKKSNPLKTAESPR
jgi:hypothetical protein